MKKSRIILGIETSCDDTSIAIIKENQSDLHSNIEFINEVKFSQEEILKKWGGVVPEIAARNHLEKITPLLNECFEKMKLAPKDIDLICVTTTPGLLGPLLTGLGAAKTLSLLFKTPLLPVNHLYAHLEAIHITQKLKYPYIGLLISGGHSLYFFVEDKNHFNILGSTIDDAAGEAFDKGGKILSLGYPAGQIIDKLASWGDPTKFEFPIGLKSSANARLSFSGLKTSLRVFTQKNQSILENKPLQFESFESSSQDFYDLCASYQDAICRALLLKMRYAIKAANEDYQAPQDCPIVLAGGVASNSYIREKFQKKYENALFVDRKFCTDNATMIANYGRLHFDEGINYPDSLKIDATGRFIQKKDFQK